MTRDRHIKLVITCGCCTSAFISAIKPELSLHAAFLATTTNLIWIWS